MDLSETDVPNLVAFLESLKDVEDGKFRDLIIKAEVFDATQPEPAPTLPPPPATAKMNDKRPNVLFIAVDDLNDWMPRRPSTGEDSEHRSACPQGRAL